jgi:O-antigen/teichoic acid export membrane protein
VNVTTRLRASRGRGHRNLLTGSVVLVAGAGIQALTGAIFWYAAAQLDRTDDVGAAAKLNTSVLFVTYLAGLGLPVALARYAANRDDDSDVTFTWAVLATVLAAVMFGLAYIAVIPSNAVDVLTDTSPILGPALFAVLVAGSALSLIADVRFMTARRWNLVLVRITAVGLLRFPLLFLMRDHAHRAFALFVFAAGPVALTGAIAAVVGGGVAGGS